MELEELENIGPFSANLLRGIGIHSRADLEKVGPLLTYKILEYHHPREVSIRLLYAFHGALKGIHQSHMSDRAKKQLREEAARHPLIIQ